MIFSNLLKSLNIEKSKSASYTVDKNLLPHKFHDLLPYIDFFAVEEQSEREDFLSSLPKECFVNLSNALDSHADLQDWMTENWGHEAYVISLLIEIVNYYLAEDIVYPPKVMTERIEKLLQMDSLGKLFGLWKINMPDDILLLDLNNFPTNLRDIFWVVNAYHAFVQNKREIPSFVIQDFVKIAKYYKEELSQNFAVATIPFADDAIEIGLIDDFRVFCEEQKELENRSKN